MHDSSLPIYISGISTYHGDLRSVTTLNKDGVADEVIETLLAGKIEKFSVSDLHPYEMALLTIEQTLAKSDIDADLVDFVIYASDTGFLRSAQILRSGRNYFIKGLAQIGISRAIPLCINGNASNNLGVALCMGADLIRNKRANNVIVVGADICVNEFDRILPPAVSLLSDGSSCCLLSNTIGKQQILAYAVKADLSLISLRPDEVMNTYLVKLSQIIKDFSQEFYKSVGKKTNAYQQLITNNYVLPSLKIYSYQLGFKDDLVFTANIPIYGHFSCGDVLFNLNSYLVDNYINNNKILIFQSGSISWSLIEMQL